MFGGGREGEGEAVFRVVDLVVLRAGARGAGWGRAAREGGRGAAREQQGGHGVVGVVWSHWFGAALEGQNFLPGCAGHGCSGHGAS